MADGQCRMGSVILGTALVSSVIDDLAGTSDTSLPGILSLFEHGRSASLVSLACEAIVVGAILGRVRAPELMRGVALTSSTA